MTARRSPASGGRGRHGDVLRRWIDALRRHAPTVAEADRLAFEEHQRVKRDVLRALMLLTTPSLAQLEQFESARVPPLLFAPLVRATDLDALGEARVEAALRRTLACPPSPAKRDVERRLREWGATGSLVASVWRRAQASAGP